MEHRPGNASRGCRGLGREVSPADAVEPGIVVLDGVMAQVIAVAASESISTGCQVHGHDTVQAARVKHGAQGRSWLCRPRQTMYPEVTRFGLWFAWENIRMRMLLCRFD